MSEQFFSLTGQPIGRPVPNWTGAKPPVREVLQGRFCRLEPLDVGRHRDGLWDAYSHDESGRNWTYLAQESPRDVAELEQRLSSQAASDDPLFFAVVESKGRQAVGLASYLRIAPAAGSLEIGHLHFSPLMQRTPIATETLYLLLHQAFEELGYRRCEWKCDSLNAPSRAAAGRFGFRYEGLFRQALVTKGRNRDTAWYAILDSEWVWLSQAYRQWLDPSNFTPEGEQKTRLSQLTKSGN